MRRPLIFTTLGSLGDVHPMLALSLELKRRGHDVVFATSPYYRPRIEAVGLGFAPVGPDVDPTEPALVERLMGRRGGLKALMNELLFKHLERTYRDLATACHNAVGLVSGNNCYAPPLVHESLGIPWASTILQPFGFFSAYDPPVIPSLTWLRHVYRLGPVVNHGIITASRAITGPWCAEVHHLRRELGLKPVGNPIFDGQHSPELVLGMFSRHVFPAQPDWPKVTRTTGFVFYDQQGDSPSLSPQLEAFLRDGEPPVVFTLGSASVVAPGDFFEQSARTAQELDVRAVLLMGPHADLEQLKGGRRLHVARYAPFSKLFPRARAVVHQCGAGTCAQALLGGKPQLLVPQGQDQVDNAYRLEKLGVGRILRRGRYTWVRATKALEGLLSSRTHADAAFRMAAKLKAEDGTRQAADEVEVWLQGRQPLGTPAGQARAFLRPALVRYS